MTDSLEEDDVKGGQVTNDVDDELRSARKRVRNYKRKTRAANKGHLHDVPLRRVGIDVGF